MRGSGGCDEALLQPSARKREVVGRCRRAVVTFEVDVDLCDVFAANG